MPARDQGAKAGAELDHLTQKSYQEYGYQAGEKIDRMRDEFNDSLRTRDGKTPEDHFKEIYGATASLVGHTYNYAWSWVPFTKQKVAQTKQGLRDGKENAKQMGQDGKEYMLNTSANGMMDDAQDKGDEMMDRAGNKAGQVKDRAMNTELGNTDVSLGSLIDESRSLVGQILNTMVYYVRVAEQTADDAVKDPSGTAFNVADKTKGKLEDGAKKTRTNKPRSNSLISRARNLTAFIMEKSSEIITLGQEKASRASEMGASAEMHGPSGGKTGFQVGGDGSASGSSYAQAVAGGKSKDGTTSSSGGAHFALSMEI